MKELSNNKEVLESKPIESEGYKEIKSENELSVDEAKAYIEKLFADKEESEDMESDNPEKQIEKTLDEYFDDLKEKSECSETIPDEPFKPGDLRKISPEENAERREVFEEKKRQLKKEWEEANGRPWPKYENDVYSANGKLIRKAGSDYDAHHIQPLGMGGKNVASNITPLNAEVHYDKQGVHSADSPYSKLDQILGGME